MGDELNGSVAFARGVDSNWGQSPVINKTMRSYVVSVEDNIHEDETNDFQGQ